MTTTAATKISAPRSVMRHIAHHLSQRAAYRFIHVAEVYGSKLTTVVGPKALYELAAPSTPPEVREVTLPGYGLPIWGCLTLWRWQLRRSSA